MTRLITALIVTIGLLPAAVPAGAAELVMLEQDYCSWCERWNEEIGPIYPKTEESRLAPLRRVDIHDPMPADLAFLQTGNFTPTFVLIDQGREIGRIRGYPGEDFFWGLLAGLIKQLRQSR